VHLFVLIRQSGPFKTFCPRQCWRHAPFSERIDRVADSIWPVIQSEEELAVAKKGTGYFDRKGHFFKTGREATESDLASLLGQIGDGESLAPGIAHMLLERRTEVERLFAEHDEMMAEEAAAASAKLTDIADKVTKLPRSAS
jgi:hypothetical protein